MSTKTKLVIVTLLFALPAFFLGHTIWPDPMGAPVPTQIQMILLIILSAIDSITFGVGVTFLIFGWSLVKRAMPHHRRAALLCYFAVAWLLVSWWPHTNLHRANGIDLAGLIKIDYGFHVTLMLAGFIAAYCFVRFLKPADALTQRA